MSLFHGGKRGSNPLRDASLQLKVSFKNNSSPLTGQGLSFYIYCGFLPVNGGVIGHGVRFVKLFISDPFEYALKKHLYFSKPRASRCPGDFLAEYCLLKTRH